MGSTLSTFVIDCQGEDLAGAARFWSAALRRDVKTPAAGDDRYRDLRCAPGEPLLMVQRVEHASRIHLDIESDDIDTEVARLVALGAREVERIRTWVVMEAPTGQRFCVVRQQRPDQIAPPTEPLWPSLAGSYKGKVRTYLEQVCESDDTLFVEPMLGGRFVRMQWFGSVNGAKRTGEIVLGRNGKTDEMTWVDTFHTSPSIMWSTGAAQQDGRIVVTATYAGTWRWRTEWSLSPLRMRAYNIAPDDTETLGIEVDWVRD